MVKFNNYFEIRNINKLYLYPKEYCSLQNYFTNRTIIIKHHKSNIRNYIKILSINFMGSLAV